MSKTIAKISALFLVALLFFVGAFFLLRTSVDDKASQARAQARFLAMQVESFHADTGKFPTSLDELTLKSALPKGLGPYARFQTFIDPWGRKYFYRTTANNKYFLLFTLGEDGKLGGSGQNEDFQVELPSNEI